MSQVILPNHLLCIVWKLRANGFMETFLRNDWLHVNQAAIKQYNLISLWLTMKSTFICNGVWS